jgi:hypothetical protein
MCYPNKIQFRHFSREKSKQGEDKLVVLTLNLSLQVFAKWSQYSIDYNWPDANVES